MKNALIPALLCLACSLLFAGPDAPPTPGTAADSDSVAVGLPAQGSLYQGYQGYQGAVASEVLKSINTYLRYLFQELYLPVYIVYDNDDSYAAAQVMLNFLVYQRGFYRAQARSGDANIFLMPARECNGNTIHNFNTIMIGNPKTHRGIEYFHLQDPLKYGKFKGMYKLYENPRSLVITARNPKYYPEITRALTRGFSQYTGPCYVYDLAN
jgi:hypothetical protein